MCKEVVLPADNAPAWLKRLRRLRRVFHDAWVGWKIWPPALMRFGAYPAAIQMSSVVKHPWLGLQNAWSIGVDGLTIGRAREPPSGQAGRQTPMEIESPPLSFKLHEN